MVQQFAYIHRIAKITLLLRKNTKCDSTVFPLHRLSLRKSPIKNHATLFRVESSSGSNTIRLHKVQHFKIIYMFPQLKEG